MLRSSLLSIKKDIPTHISMQELQYLSDTSWELHVIITKIIEQKRRYPPSKTLRD